MKKKLYIAALLFFALLANANAESRGDIFFDANKAYESGEYDIAVAGYEQVIDHFNNDIIYYNIGNCYFKQGRIGKALANYLRAKRAAPADSDINDNINYIRTLTKDKIEDKRIMSFIRRIFFYYDAFSFEEFFYAFAALSAILFSLLSIRLFSKWNGLDILKNIVIVLITFTVVGAALNYKVYFYDTRGVVVNPEVSVRSGSSPNDTVLFNLHEGTEFIVLTDDNRDFIKIELTDNKKGWVLRKVVELI